MLKSKLWMILLSALLIGGIVAPAAPALGAKAPKVTSVKNGKGKKHKKHHKKKHHKKHHKKHKKQAKKTAKK